MKKGWLVVIIALLCLALVGTLSRGWGGDREESVETEDKSIPLTEETVAIEEPETAAFGAWFMNDSITEYTGEEISISEENAFGTYTDSDGGYTFDFYILYSSNGEICLEGDVDSSTLSAGDTIEFDGVLETNADFVSWMKANATYVESNVLDGTYVLNETLDETALRSLPNTTVAFTSGDASFSQLYSYDDGGKIGYVPEDGGEYVAYDSSSGWNVDAYRYLTFDNITVSYSFAAWLQLYAVKQ